MSESGKVVVLGPEEGASFWQPVPANGFVRCLFDAASMGAGMPFSMGTQQVAPGCFVREHIHAEHDELAYVLSGEGALTVEGAPQPLRSGSSCFIGRGRKHSFVNTGAAPLEFVWFILPGGLDRFFAAIGRPRQPGEPAPEPFPRPENIAEIEAKSVFGWTDQRFDPKAPPA